MNYKGVAGVQAWKYSVCILQGLITDTFPCRERVNCEFFALILTLWTKKEVILLAI